MAKLFFCFPKMPFFKKFNFVNFVWAIVSKGAIIIDETTCCKIIICISAIFNLKKFYY